MSGKNILKKLTLILPLLTVVFVSGCTGNGGTVSFGNGVIIQAWEPDFSSLESEETVTFYLKIQNQGESLAENVEALIMGIDASEWSIKDGEYDFDDMIAPDIVASTPGEIKTKYYKGEAPELLSSARVDYAPIVRVSYDYSTKVNKPITVVDITELRAIMREGGSIPSKETSYTAGPLSVDIITGKYAKTDAEDPEFPLTIVITNTLWGSNGARVVATRSSPKLFQFPVKLDVDVSGSGSVDCNTENDWVDLWASPGQPNQIEVTCILELEPADEGTRVERLITADLTYRYQIDATTSVTVTG